MSQSIERATTVLLWLARAVEGDGAGIPLREIARGTDLDKATTHRVLQSLAKAAFIRQNMTTRNYTLGPSAIALSGPAQRAHPFLPWTIPVAQQLAAETDETISIAERTGLNYMTIYEIESKQVVRYANHLGRSTRLNVAAGGLSILAWSSQEILDSILKDPLEAATSKTVTSPSALNDRLALIRSTGYAWSNSERHHNVYSIAVPIFTSDSHAVGSASIIWPSRGSRIDKARLDSWPSILKQSF